MKSLLSDVKSPLNGFNGWLDTKEQNLVTERQVNRKCSTEAQTNEWEKKTTTTEKRVKDIWDTVKRSNM